MRRIIFFMTLSCAISSLFAQSDTVRYENGNVFVGDTITHRGVLFTLQGDVFKGSIVGGKAEGIGTYYGKRKGKGEVKYYGAFSGGKFCGKGRLDANGKVYVSDFSDGVPIGNGIIFYKNGDVYAGEIGKGVPNGQGRRYSLIYYRSERRYMYYEGKYVKGRLIDGYSYNPSRLANRFSAAPSSVRSSENMSVESGERKYYTYTESKKTELEIQKEYTALMSELKPFAGERLTKAEIRFSKQIGSFER